MVSMGNMVHVPLSFPMLEKMRPVLHSVLLDPLTFTHCRLSAIGGETWQPYSPLYQRSVYEKLILSHIKYIT